MVGRVESGDVVCGGVSGEVEAVVHEEGFDFRLERDGLINRTICPIDLRAKQISLTDKGKDLLRRTLPVVEGFDKAFFTSKDRSKDALNPAT